MKYRIWISLCLVVVLVGCGAPVNTPTVRGSPTLQGTPAATIAAFETVSPVSTKQETLPPFAIDWTEPFAGNLIGDGSNRPKIWTLGPYAGENIPLPVDLNQVPNVQTLDSLTPVQKAFLSEYGFVVIHSQEAQFGDIRVDTSQRTGQPYYLTTDAALHALHLLFDDMLKALERELFRPNMIAITQATLEQLRSELPALQGTSMEAEAQQALAYLSVALKLFDPAAEVDPSVEAIVSEQVEQIMRGNGREYSVLFPDFEDDYGGYKPVGHYAGDPDLEAYFRGMTWYGRMHFRLQDPERPAFRPSRVPLIVTLALRQAQVDGQPASTLWADLHRTLTFVIGPSDDAGPLEYTELITLVYGDHPGIQDLADEGLWQDFLARSDQLPAPQINSLFVTSTVALAPEKGWRFMGQRFTLDGMIFQNVIFDQVKAKSDGTKRELPSGLDVMAAFGSAPALQELEKQDITTFPNYTEQMEKMRQAILAQSEEQWLARFYDTWLYSFRPVVQRKDSAYPAYMQTSAWGYKDLNAALGSWAELKHDTVLYTKMPEMAGGGGPPMSDSAPSYVEPNPEAFYRMAYMARTLSCGLQEHVLPGPCDPDSLSSGLMDASDYIAGMSRLAERLEMLGDIAVKELAGISLDEAENSAITDCLGMIECLNTDTGYNQPNSEMPEVPVIAAVSGARDHVLEVGVGKVDRMYVVVPLEGRWEIAQGGVFSYYEFSQPRNQRLTDQDWRAKLADGEVELPAWTSNFLLPGGEPGDALFFRKGDIYIITQAGDKLNVRDQPSTSGTIMTQLKTGDYAEIVDGPIQADGYTWWKFKLYSWDTGSETAGWAVEDQDWYVRSYAVNQPQK